MASRGDWLSETKLDGAVRFVVKQRKEAPLKIWLGTLCWAILLLVIAFAAAGLGTGAGFALALMSGIMGAILLLFATFGALILLPMWAARKEIAEFTIDVNGIKLIKANDSKFPATIALNQIAQLYRSNSVKPQPIRSTATVVAGSAPAVAAFAVASSLGNVSNQTGAMLAQMLAMSSHFVAVNAVGQEIKLGAHLNKNEANLLMHRIEVAFAG